MGSSDFELPLPAFLDAVARETSTPGGGSVSAVAGAMAAALVEMAAQYSHDWDDAAGTRDQARVLRERLSKLASADAVAYEAFLAAEPADRARALALATEVPAQVVKSATEVVDLATLVYERGNPNLQGDAYAAAQLAGAAVQAAGTLVAINREKARKLGYEPTSEG